MVSCRLLRGAAEMLGVLVPDYRDLLMFLARHPPELDTERELHASLLEQLAKELRAGRREPTRTDAELFLAQAFRSNVNRSHRGH